MNYKLIRLANKLRVLTVPIKGANSATVTIWIKVGSRKEENKMAGVSHFLEHMVFKGSKKRPSARLIAEVIDGIGGEFNASTGKEWTNFYIKAKNDNLSLVFDVLSDMVLNPILKPSDVEREKGVILEEMAMYEDTPMLKVGDIYERLIFKGSSLGRDIIGNKRSIRQMKKQDFIKYRNRHYFSENMLVTVSGGVSENEVISLANKLFGKVKSNQDPDSESYVSSQQKPQVKLQTKKNEQAHFIIGFKGNKMDHKDRFKESVLSAILGQGMSSRLFTEVREKRGLAYAVKTDDYHYTDTGYVSTYVGADIKRIDEAIKVVLDQHYGLISKKYQIRSKEIKKAKEYVKGHLALSLEDTKNINNFFGIRELLINKIETPKQVFEAIDKVSIDEVIEVGKKIFVSEKLNLAIIGPYQDQARFEKLIK